MPRDLFQEAGISPHQPIDLLANQQFSAAPNLPDAALGISPQALQSLVGGFLETASLPGKGIHNLISRLIPGIQPIQSTQVLPPDQEQSGAAMIGRGLGGAAAAVPFLAGGEALIPEMLGSAAVRSIAGQALGGSALGGLEHPGLKGILGGGIAGAAGGALGNIASGLARTAGRYIAGRAVQPLMQKVESGIKPTTDSLADTLGKAYQSAKAKTTEWQNTLIPLAKQADSSSPNFDSSIFQQEIKNLLKQYEPKMSRLSDKYGPAKKELEKLQENPPSSYLDATHLNEYLNDLPKTFEATNDPQQQVLRNISGNLKDALQQQVEKNSTQSDLGKQFVDLWNRQRQNYQYLKSFEKVPVGRNDDGSLRLSYKKKLANQIEGGAPDEDIAQHFMPTSKEQGTLKIDHLSNLVGDPQIAQNLLKNEFIKNSTEQGIFNPKKALNSYLKLSDQQRSAMFLPQEKALFDSASKAKSIDEKNRILNSIRSFINQRELLRMGLPPAIGMSLGILHGTPTEGAGAGVIGSLLGGLAVRGAAQRAATPEAIESLARFTEQGNRPFRGISYPVTGMGLNLFSPQEESR